VAQPLPHARAQGQPNLRRRVASADAARGLSRMSQDIKGRKLMFKGLGLSISLILAGMLGLPAVILAAL